MTDVVYERLDELVVEGKPLGRHVHHDPKSRQYAFKLDQPLTAPLASVEHKILLDVLDQGSIGSCVPNTGTEFLAWEVIFKTLPVDVQRVLGQPFAVDLYREVTRADPFDGAWEPDDTGTDGLSLAKVLKTRGLISGYVHTFDPASALVALQKSPLAIGIQWLSGCDNPDANGLISYTGYIRGGHEVLVVGYDAENQLVKIRNHWTKFWGVNGHAFMTVADFTRAIKNNGDVTILVPLNALAPVPTPVPVVNSYTEQDRSLNELLKAWEPTIFSKITKAGKLKEYVRNVWRPSKGL